LFHAVAETVECANRHILGVNHAPIAVV